MTQIRRCFIEECRNLDRTSFKCTKSEIEIGKNYQCLSFYPDHEYLREAFKGRVYASIKPQEGKTTIE